MDEEQSHSSGPGSLEVGAKYTVKGYSARNGNPMGFMKTLVFPDGSALSNPSVAQVRERLAG